MRLTFLGATETVTGSKTLVEKNGKKILVDCGLFQGDKELRLRNWGSLPLTPTEIDAVVLTHAHIDHTGYLPRFVKEGFKGPIYCTEATADLCHILLKDSAYLQEEDARRANRYGYTRHKPALPLYTKEDAEAALALLEPQPFDQGVGLDDELFFSFHPAGHILGASYVMVSDESCDILFSGDIGRHNDPLLHPPVPPKSCHYLVLESTYGNRLHGEKDPIEEIGRIIRETASRGGSVLIPSFAVGRAQLLLYYIHQLKKNDRIPDLPVYLDSPMAINATELFCKHHAHHRLEKSRAKEVCGVASYVQTVEESKRLNSSHFPRVIISASGMATGGRVLHHLEHFLPREENCVLFSGFQSHGTRGARLVAGERECKIHGQFIPVRARIENLENCSAHADQRELLHWLEGMERPPKKVFLNHGEPEALKGFSSTIKKQLGWKVEVPRYLQQVECK